MYCPAINRREKSKGEHDAERRQSGIHHRGHGSPWRYLQSGVVGDAEILQRAMARKCALFEQQNLLIGAHSGRMRNGALERA